MMSTQSTEQLYLKWLKLKSYKNALKQKLANDRFSHFFNFIWSQAIRATEGTFRPGAHLDRWCDELQDNNRTSKESARKHAKSECLHAFAPWLFFQKKRSVELDYFSYKDGLAAYHVAKIKKAMLEIPEFKGVKWISPAESIVYCKWPYTKITLQITPMGFKGAKRGRHPHGVICDDILKDPTQRKLNVGELKSLARTFAEEVLSMPKEGGWLHNSGTSQDPTDLFHENRKRKGFLCTTEPAIRTVKGKRVALWPEMFPLKRLDEIKNEIGEKAFNKEYLCAPVRGEEGYFKYSEIEAIEDALLVAANLETFKTDDSVFGGMDIGKKRHPSHITLGREHDGHLTQILSKWLDGWDYTEQVDYLDILFDKLSINCLKYDNTRSELESFAEQGKLPNGMEPVVATGKKNFELAALLESRIRAKPKPTITLLKDDRQKNQIIAVDNDLHAPETPEGHGDSFWSNALMCDAAKSGHGDYVN